MESVCPWMRSPIAASARMVTKEPCATSKGKSTIHARTCNAFMVSARSRTQARPIANATEDSMGTSVTKVR